MEKKDNLSQSKKKTINESLATLEEHLFLATNQGNKKEQDAIKATIRAIKKRKATLL